MKMLASTLILVFMATNLHSNDQLMVNLLPSTEWQKLQLEGVINKKIRSVLSPIVDNKKLIIDMQIDISQSPKPKFKKPQTDKKKEALAKEKAEKNAKKNRIRINDQLPDKLPKDYIIFSKLGLEAPLIEDILANELKKNQMLAQANKNKEKAKKKQQELPKLEQTWNYNESLDIFKNLEEIVINIKIDKSLEALHSNEIKNLIDNARFSYGEITPEIKITYIQLTKNLFPNGIKSYIDYASKFSNGVGVILAVFLFGLFALIIFKKYEKLKREEMENSNQMAAAAIPENKENPEDKEKESDKENNPSAIPGLDGESTEFIGIKRFHHYLENSQDLAIMMIRRWVNSEGPPEKMALKALVQQLENTDLETIFSVLNKNLRGKWREKLDGPLNMPELLLANQFISNQIIEDIIIPNIIDDPELQELLLSITPEIGHLMIEQSTEYGVVLMHLLQSNILAEIFNLTEPSVVDNVVKDSVHFNENELEKYLVPFKNALIEHSSPKEDGEMVNKILELIPNLSKDQEVLLYKNIAASIEKKRLINLASTNFPSELVPKLSNDIIKGLFSTYTMNKKVETLLSLDDDLFEWKMDIIAPVGSKAKDLFELEFEKNKSDLEFMRKLKNEKSIIWKKHIDGIREYLTSNKQFNGEVNDIVSNWAQTLYTGEDDTELVKEVA